MITVYLPSRGRPQQIESVYTSFYDTKALDDTQICLVVSEDDPKLQDYLNLNVRHDGLAVAPSNFNTLTKKLNWVTSRDKTSNILGFVADDNIFRSYGWDVRITEGLTKPGIAYGNDLYQGPGLPTSVFISNEIVQALGWFALPDCEHMYLDNAWKVLGERLGRLVYLPDVIIEHLHPVVGKREWDETYDLSNTEQILNHDRESFARWEQFCATEDVMRINEALNV